MPRARKIPQRMCIVCREMKPKKELIRIVRTPSAEVVVDTTGKISGRGAYICPQPGCLKQAVASKRLDRALKHQIDDKVLQALSQYVGKLT